MQRLLSVIKSSLLVGLVALLTGIIPSAAVYAETTEECVPPAESAAGVHRPVGADAAAYTYNCDTGLWESSHYIFYPSSGQILPKDPVIYTYNQTSGQWDSTVWSYNAPSGQYIAWTNSVASPPDGAQRVGGPTPSQPTSSANASPSGASASAGVGNGSTSSSSVSGTGTLNATTLAAIANALNSSAASGNAGVKQNTSAGSASTGDAVAIANIVNMLQSMGNAFGSVSDLVTFISNIDGDVFGDLFLDPGQLSTLGNKLQDKDLTINNSSDNKINNNINVQAQSGNAEVSENTTAGDASTGAAKAVANIVNIINSAITSGKSFLGVVNINGNLNGDILLPADFIDQLLAANVPTTTINTAQLMQNDSSAANVTNTGINNNLSATAGTGNATTGVASTNITAFNLTGSNTIGKNSILVFVNVLGNWVGMIVNAPEGATAAQLGGGVTQHSTGNKNVSNTTNNQINNNVTVGAQSGNASVDRNTTAGNATTGDADAAINLLNIANSNMSFSDWMGILFINVFGTWNGSFGIDTAAGNRPVSAAPEVALPAQVFRFAPAAASAPEKKTNNQAATTTPTNTPPTEEAKDQAPASTLGSETNTPSQATPQSETDKLLSRWTIPFLFTGVLGLIVLAFERLAQYRRNKLNLAKPLLN